MQNTTINFSPQMTNASKQLGRIIAIFIIVLSLVKSAVFTVEAGEVGVIKRFGEVSRKIDPGIHFKIPFAERVVKLPTRKVTYETSSREKQNGSDATYKDFPVDTNTSDGQPVDVSYTIRFSVDPSKAPWIVQNIGTADDLVEKIVKSESRVWARNIPRNYQAVQLYQGEGSIEIQNAIFDKLESQFSDNGLILDFVGIREIVFDSAYVNAIKDKQTEEVKIQTEANKAEQEKFKKEQRITQAEGLAEEQRLQRETISPQILQRMWIEQWNGVLPQTMLGEDASTLLQLPQ